MRGFSRNGSHATLQPRKDPSGMRIIALCPCRPSQGDKDRREAGVAAIGAKPGKRLAGKRCATPVQRRHRNDLQPEACAHGASSRYHNAVGL